MRIVVIGGGPAGLYFALLMKRHDADHHIVVVEQNAPDATYGFGVVFSARALGFLEADDPETYRLLSSRMEVWDDLVMVHRGRPIPIDGNGFSAIAWIDLLRLLQDGCRDTGVAMHFNTPVRDMAFADFDLVVVPMAPGPWCARPTGSISSPPRKSCPTGSSGTAPAGCSTH